MKKEYLLKVWDILSSEFRNFIDLISMEIKSTFICNEIYLFIENLIAISHDKIKEKNIHKFNLFNPNFCNFFKN